MNKNQRDELLNFLIIGLFLFGFIFINFHLTGMASYEIMANPVVTLISPANNTQNYTFDMKFAYSVTDADVGENIVNCTLLISHAGDWQPNQSTNSITEGATQDFSVTLSTMHTPINWTVQCEDDGGIKINGTNGFRYWNSSISNCGGIDITTPAIINLTGDVDCTSSNPGYVYQIESNNTMIDCSGNRVANDNTAKPIINIPSRRNNITIINCNFSGNDPENPIGYAIENDYATYGLTNSIIRNCSFDYKERGIHVDSRSSFDGVNITGNSFKNNTDCAIYIEDVKAIGNRNPNWIVGNNFTNTPNHYDAGGGDFKNKAISITSSETSIYLRNNSFSNNAVNTNIIWIGTNASLDIDGSNTFNETRNTFSLSYCEKCRIKNINLTNINKIGSNAGYGFYACLIKTNLTNVTARYRNYGIYTYADWEDCEFYGNNISGNDFRDSSNTGMYLAEDSVAGTPNYIENNNLSNCSTGINYRNSKTTTYFKNNDFSNITNTPFYSYSGDNIFIYNNIFDRTAHLSKIIYIDGVGPTSGRRAENVTIDNVTIVGNGTGSGIYLVNEINKSKIINCNISNMESGIYIERMFDGNISYNNLFNNTIAIDLENKVGISSKNVSIYHNNITGENNISLKLNLLGSLIKYNNFTNSTLYCVYQKTGGDNTFDGNYFEKCYNTSIYISSSGEDIIKNSNFTGNNSGIGIYLLSSDNWIDNVSIYNKSYAVWFDGAGNNLTNSTFKYSSNYDLYSTSTDSVIDSNNFLEGSIDSIFIDSTFVGNNIIQNNNFSGNNSGHGIEVKSEENWIINNTIWNKSYGVYFSGTDSDSNNVTNNTFRYNNVSIYFVTDAGDLLIAGYQINPFGGGDGTGNVVWNNSFLETRNGGNFSEAETSGNMFNTSYIGNYWFGIEGFAIYDSNGDSIGDTGDAYPYNLTNGGNVSEFINDYLPITSKIEPSTEEQGGLTGEGPSGGGTVIEPSAEEGENQGEEKQEENVGKEEEKQQKDLSEELDVGKGAIGSLSEGIVSNIIKRKITPEYIKVEIKNNKLVLDAGGKGDLEINFDKNKPEFDLDFFTGGPNLEQPYSESECTMIPINLIILLMLFVLICFIFAGYNSYYSFSFILIALFSLIMKLYNYCIYDYLFFMIILFVALILFKIFVVNKIRFLKNLFLKEDKKNSNFFNYLHNSIIKNFKKILKIFKKFK